MKKEWGLGTRSVQGGYEPKAGEPRVLPLYQSTTYKYDDVDQVARLFDLEENGHMYSRISNPTVAALEEKVNMLEGGVGALATSSGQAASTLALLNICGAGSHVIAISTLYGGTYNLFAVTLKKIGIEVTFVDPELSAEEIEKHFCVNTRAIFTESIGNPGLNVLDFEKFAQIAKAKDVPLIVDNTFPTPYLCRPFEHGANIVIHSTTKYIDGHASSVGGIIVDGGNFNWNTGKYPEITEPDPSYHGLSYTETFGDAAYIVKARVTLMRDYGSCMSPFNAYLTNIGLETLHLRMERHSENTLKLAEFLEKHENVAWVNYPGLENHPSYALAQKYLPKGASGVLTFGVKGGYEAGKKFMNSLKLAALVVHVADVRSSVLHPASMTHRQLTEEQQIACGITPDLIRVSVGIEDIEDIIKDFDQALK
ncbi:O-acetylhomoserine sulfhydrylase [Desulfonispora thiosulfatigenes DSM 11270]|uniref:O-succinylhomoserine sulfhydrylase n=2 Tax=Desulfonispora thiosulfatigenes TaxID=83661 RepID=A0A1W1V2N0_DESTI|nr:O-acetylhomoserine aminocarboxypropyltransferase/cysteine synthase family protein [Desulfonispora thiosulfatigenes]SMB87281.1 O-acetylhomoserine sulfhydrylase [Desulfonispora thiosulfatigenes DSM 11270]